MILDDDAVYDFIVSLPEYKEVEKKFGEKKLEVNTSDDKIMRVRIFSPVGSIRLNINTESRFTANSGFDTGIYKVFRPIEVELNKRYNLVDAEKYTNSLLDDRLIETDESIVGLDLKNTIAIVHIYSEDQRLIAHLQLNLVNSTVSFKEPSVREFDTYSSDDLSLLAGTYRKLDAAGFESVDDDIKIYDWMLWEMEANDNE